MTRTGGWTPIKQGVSRVPNLFYLSEKLEAGNLREGRRPERVVVYYEFITPPVPPVRGVEARKNHQGHQGGRTTNANRGAGKGDEGRR